MSFFPVALMSVVRVWHLRQVREGSKIINHSELDLYKYVINRRAGKLYL